MYNYLCNLTVIVLVSFNIATSIIDNECPKDKENNNVLVLYKDNNLSNTTFTRLVCKGCMNSEDGYIYWLGHNNTFPNKLSNVTEGEDVTTNLGNDMYKHVRELNISSLEYTGKNFSCVSMTEYGTTFYYITL
ncbi:SWPV1-263 [Shearwaterpox virus]|uniref:SWPV1-263 n=1 Tax=Shearwaterpox virus TaxID=1974596 RepID=A0A1V0S870_CNPV|nr:SWPV1-263 [Shearwaterpox virus]